MRVLTVGNMYPPHHQGGYELVWQGAVEHLRARGHAVTVLCSDHREPGVPVAEEPGVRRELRWWWRAGGWPRFTWRERRAVERHNAAALDRALAETRADRVAWWSMGGLTLSLIDRVRRAGLPAAGFVHDDWMLYGPRVDRGRRRAPDLACAATWMFVSEHTRRRALSRWDLPRTGVAPSGIDPSFLDARPAGEWRWRLLCAGRIDPRKGVLTAVQALAQLPAATLVVAGAGDTAALAAEAAALGVAERLELPGPLGRPALRAAYAAADAVVFPVVWDEPWGLVALEGMAARRPVLATGRGGSAEYLRDGENCLLFAAGDAAALAAAARRLAADQALRERLVAGGARTARAHTADVFHRQVEETLLGLP